MESRIFSGLEDHEIHDENVDNLITHFSTIQENNDIKTVAQSVNHIMKFILRNIENISLINYIHDECFIMSERHEGHIKMYLLIIRDFCNQNLVTNKELFDVIPGEANKTLNKLDTIYPIVK